MQNIEVLKQFIADELVPEENLSGLNENQSLLETGIIDSLGMLKLVSFIETKFRIQIGDEELIPENFENLSSLAEMVSKKNGGPS